MTPLQLAIKECANMHDWACMHVMIGDDLGQACREPLPKCSLASQQRCEYFEACVLPMVRWLRDPKRHASVAQAKLVYELKHRNNGLQPGKVIGTCPDCDKPRRKNARYCPECAERHRKERQRIRVAEHRSRVTEMSQKNHAFAGDSEGDI